MKKWPFEISKTTERERERERVWFVGWTEKGNRESKKKERNTERVCL